MRIPLATPATLRTQGLEHALRAEWIERHLVCVRGAPELAPATEAWLRIGLIDWRPVAGRAVLAWRGRPQRSVFRYIDLADDHEERLQSFVTVVSASGGPKRSHGRAGLRQAFAVALRRKRRVRTVGRRIEVVYPTVTSLRADLYHLLDGRLILPVPETVGRPLVALIELPDQTRWKLQAVCTPWGLRFRPAVPFVDRLGVLAGSPKAR